MSNIKCPNDKVIKKQIAMIIDASGMFEDDTKDNSYVECRPVKKGSAVKNISMFICAAAMFLIFTLVVIPVVSNNKSKIEPYSSRQYTDGKSEISIKYVTESEIGRQDGEDLSISYQYVYPDVRKDGKDVEFINDTYSEYTDELISDTRKFYGDSKEDGKSVYKIEDIKAKIEQYRKKQIQDETEKTKQFSDSTDTVPLTVKCITKFSDGISEHNSNVLSFVMSIEDYVQFWGTGDNTSQTTRIRKYGKNFDLGLNRELTYSDLFYTNASYENGINNILKVVRNMGYDYTKEMLEKENNWCFSEEEITIFLNDALVKENTADSYSLQRHSCVTVTVKYTEIEGMKNEYRN